MSFLDTPRDLPQLGVTRADFYRQIENATPGADFAGPTIKVAGGAVNIADSVPRWIKVTKGYADFAAGATTNDIEVLLLPPNGVIQAVAYQHGAAFGGGGLSALTISVGVTGNATKYGAARDVVAAPNTLNTLGGGGTESNAASASIRAFASATGDNLNAATTGSIDIWICYAVLPSS
ncbi:MAG TPA: hypothetical protein VHC95_07125 [Opitutales bacterium]|nr:hypothetical protein [Opitutales bacterium]